MSTTKTEPEMASVPFDYAVRMAAFLPKVRIVVFSIEAENPKLTVNLTKDLMAILTEIEKLTGETPKFIHDEL